MMTFFSSSCALPMRHWKMAECSLSTGSRATPFFATASMTMEPPATRVSLLARAMSIPASMAASVGRSPTMPETAVSSISAESQVATAMSPSMPESTSMSGNSAWIRFLRSKAASGSITPTSAGWYRRICSSRASISLKQEILTTFSSSGNSSTTDSACVPMDPVEPMILIFFIVSPRIIFVYLFIIA